MVGSSSDVNQGTTVDGKTRIRRSQSVRSSEEAANYRGAKGRRKVVSLDPSATMPKQPGKVPQGYPPGCGEEPPGQNGDKAVDRLETGERGASLRGWQDPFDASGPKPQPVHLDWLLTGKLSARNWPAQFGWEGSWKHGSYPYQPAGWSEREAAV